MLLNMLTTSSHIKQQTYLVYLMKETII